MLNKLFVYGIFLSETMRESYGMFSPQYAVVKDYATWGNDIVTAYKQENAGLALTGLLVHVAPYTHWGDQLNDNWERLDALEGGYDRVEITTVQGDKAYMYVGKEADDTKNRDS